MKKLAAVLLVAGPILVLMFFAALNPPKAEAVPSYARQTGWPAAVATTLLRNSTRPDEGSSCSDTWIGRTRQRS